jgi:predicted Rossmann fold flavoprotein
MPTPDGVYDLIVIGGGAAGFFGALSLVERRPASRILILEKGNSLLGKVRISGGGRCNVTHALFDPARLVEQYPRGGRSLRGLFHRFQPSDTVAWFERRGVRLKTEPDGRMFPTTDRSETIIDLFLSEAKRTGIEIVTRAPIIAIRPEAASLQVEGRDGQLWLGRAVLLATGGERGGFELATGVGHAIVPPVPSLFTFKVADPRLEGLAGVSVADALISLPAYRLSQRGAVLVTHWGLSGPATIRLSAWAARELANAQYQTELRVNWLPDKTEEDLLKTFRWVRSTHPQRQVTAFDPASNLPQRLWRRLAGGVAGERTWGELSNAAATQLAGELLHGVFKVSGKGEFKEEFVTAGGVPLEEVDLRRMESRRCPGLFLAGEVLDVDGVTGGFNFQHAWTTAWVAAQAVAGRLEAGEAESQREG